MTHKVELPKDKWRRRIDIEQCFVGHNFPNTEIVLRIEALLKLQQEALLSKVEAELPQEKLVEPDLRQYEHRDSAPFFCSLCGMGEITLMERKEGDMYYCHCSYWTDPHNAYLDRSGGNWIKWFDKDTAQNILDSQPTLSIEQVKKTVNKLRLEL